MVLSAVAELLPPCLRQRWQWWELHRLKESPATNCRSSRANPSECARCKMPRGWSLRLAFGCRDRGCLSLLHVTGSAHEDLELQLTTFPGSMPNMQDKASLYKSLEIVARLCLPASAADCMAAAGEALAVVTAATCPQHRAGQNKVAFKSPPPPTPH